jgi:hypothetical protein
MTKEKLRNSTETIERGEPFQRLCAVVDGNHGVIEAGGLKFEIDKHIGDNRFPGIENDFLGLLRSDGEERQDLFIVTEDGMKELHIKYPPLFEISSGDSLFPADRSPAEQADLEHAWAVNLMEFVEEKSRSK